MLEYIQAVVLSIAPILGMDIMSVITSLTTKRTFGVELELVGMSMDEVEEALISAGVYAAADGYNHEVKKYWKIVDDGSLTNYDCERHSYPTNCTVHTAEVVSPILCGISGLVQTARVLMALKNAGAYANDTCGIHIHVDAPEYWQAWDKVYQLMVTYVGLGLSHEDNALRPYNQYADTVDFPEEVVSRIFREETEAIRYGRTLESAMYRSNERYYAVNYCSMYKHKTIEFRQLAGTFNLLALLKWIVAVVMLTETVSDYEGCPSCGGHDHSIHYCTYCGVMKCSNEHPVITCDCGRKSCRTCDKARCHVCNSDHCLFDSGNHNKYCYSCGNYYCGDSCNNSRHCSVCDTDSCSTHFRGTCSDCDQGACANTVYQHGHRCRHCNTRYCGYNCPNDC